MILTLAYRGVFRQEQYETVTVEGSLTLDTDRDLPERDIRGPDELAAYMTDYLDRLLKPAIDRAADISRYDEAETVLYDWKGFIDAATDKAPPQQQGRRTHRRS